MKLKHILNESIDAALEKAFETLIGSKPGIFIDTDRKFIQTDYEGRRVSEKQVLGLFAAAGVELVRKDENEPEPGERKGYTRYYYK